MSSFGELEYCVTDVPKIKPFDPYLIAQDYVTFPITKMQPTYFLAESFADAKAKIIDYCDHMPKPFSVSYNSTTHCIEVDRKIKTRHDWDMAHGDDSAM